jgi:Icc protein
VPETLKIALVTDIHNGRNSLTKKGAAAIPLLGDFTEFVRTEQPDLVVELGDRITDANLTVDQDLLRGVSEQFEKMSARCVHLLGNHDVAHLSREDNEHAFSQDMRSTSIDLKGWHLIFWQANVDISLHEPLLLREEELAWLEADLAGTSLPSIVFTHIPLDGASMTGNFYFQASPQIATYANVAQAQAIISTAGNVAACIAGHVHWNNISRIDGVPYITLQSLTESFTTQGEASGGWAVIEADHQLRWRGYGGDPIELTVNLGSGNQRWAQPLPALHTIARKRATKGAPLGEVHALLTDLDGVIYRGDAPVEGAAEFLVDVMSSGRQVIAITNNARSTVQQYQKKLSGMGIELNEAQIITSAEAMASHLAQFKVPPKVYFAAPAALRREILAIGAVESDQPDFVVAGIDDELTVAALNRAVHHLARGARLLVSNVDVSIPTTQGRVAEAGAIVAFLETASGQTAQTFGKPNAAIFELALSRAGCQAANAIVIGDTYDTDILGANRVGIRSVYVNSGNPPNEESFAIPDVVIDDITGLRVLLGL